MVTADLAMSTPLYLYRGMPASLVTPSLLDELAALYSAHYGYWGSKGRNPYCRIRVSADYLRQWFARPQSRVAYATLNGAIVGYAIAVQPHLPNVGVISWVTQFSDHYAWGLVTANPFAVRALEKATRRRCDPVRIGKDQECLRACGRDNVPYINADTGVATNGVGARINTAFYIDHTDLPHMLAQAQRPETIWTLGSIPDGWEWLAFTFRDQPEIALTEREIETMVKTSDDVAREAYSRMRINASHHWSQHTPEEVDLIISECQLTSGMRVLDMGCGSGRHVFGLALRQIDATGIDYLKEAVDARKQEAQNNPHAHFLAVDAREIELDDTFDAVLCLYDVIGSYAEEEENERIIRTSGATLSQEAKHSSPS
jgi:hypothetical protein